MSILAILISLGLLMFLAYRGITVLLLAPLMAALAVVLSGDATALLPSYTVTFMSQLGGYLAKFFPLFILGACLGVVSSREALVKATAAENRWDSTFRAAAIKHDEQSE